MTVRQTHEQSDGDVRDGRRLAARLQREHVELERAVVGELVARRRRSCGARDADADADACATGTGTGLRLQLRRPRERERHVVGAAERVLGAQRVAVEPPAERERAAALVEHEQRVELLGHQALERHLLLCHRSARRGGVAAHEERAQHAGLRHHSARRALLVDAEQHALRKRATECGGGRRALERRRVRERLAPVARALGVRPPEARAASALSQ